MTSTSRPECLFGGAGTTRKWPLNARWVNPARSQPGSNDYRRAGSRLCDAAGVAGKASPAQRALIRAQPDERESGRGRRSELRRTRASERTTLCVRLVGRSSGSNEADGLTSLTRHKISCGEPTAHATQHTRTTADTPSVNVRLDSHSSRTAHRLGSSHHDARIPAAPLLAVSCTAWLDGFTAIRSTAWL